jgi:hypothetical protein
MFQNGWSNFTQPHYYLRDLKHVYYGCCGFPYGQEDQTLFINDEPNKVFQNSKWSGFLKIIQGTNVVKKQGATVGPCILFMAAFGWIAIGKNGSSSI